MQGNGSVYISRNFLVSIESHVSDGPNWMNYTRFSSIQVSFESVQQKLRSHIGYVEYFYQRVDPNSSEKSRPESKQDEVSENKNLSDSPQKRPFESSSLRI